MVLINIYFFFYNLQNYLYNFYNKYILFNIFSKKYIKRNDSNNSNNSDNSDNSHDFYFYLKEYPDDKNYNYMICKKCNVKILNEIYLYNDYYFCSKFCRKHYSYKI